MDSFLSRQNQIYRSFRDVMANPAAGSDGTLNQGSGCLLVLRYGNDLTRPLTELSLAISQQVPALLYQADNLHTTLNSGLALPQREQAREEDLTLFNRYRQFLSNPVTRLAERWLSEIRICPQELLFNRNSVILATEPSEAFVELARAIHMAASQAELPLQMPWGSHLTVSRFRPGHHDLSPLPALLANAELPKEVQPVGIQLVWFECNQQHFRFVAA